MNELQQNTHPLIRDGASQKQRQLEALSPDYAKVDDRSSSELLDLVYRFSRQVAFHSEGRPTDNWTAFFRNSVPVQASLISKYDVEAIAAEYREMNQLFNATHSTEHLNSLLDLTLKMAFRIHDWFLRLDGDQSGLWSLIRNLIDTDLRQELRTLIGYVKAAGSWGYVPMRSLFDFIKAREWGLNPLVLNQPDPVFLQIRGSARVRNAARKKKVDELYRIFFKGVSEIQKKAPEFFEKSLKAQEDHAPQLGLFFTFLRLYQQSQGHLNEMTKKHLDFFYKKALKLENAKEVPDQVHLVFQLLGLLDKYLLEKDTAFNAGQDENGEDILFKLLEEIVLGQAQVESLRTLFLGLQSRTPNLSGVTHECGEEEALKVSGVYMAPAANMQDGQETPFPDEFKGSWATLGGRDSKLETGVDATSGQPLFKPYPDAQLGLVLASPVLLLQEGERKITLMLQVNLDEAKTEIPDGDNQNMLREAVKTKFELNEDILDALIDEGLSQDARNHLGAMLASQARVVEPVPDDFWASQPGYFNGDDRLLLRKHLKRNHAFNVYLSGEKGWLEPYEVTMELLPKGSPDPSPVFSCWDNTVDQLVIRIALGPTFEPVTFSNPAVLGGDFKTNLPAVKLVMNHEVKVNDGYSLYHFFRYLPVLRACINVEVCGVRNLAVQNDNGLLDINGPMPVFGAAPGIGNNFYIGSKEVFIKNWEAVQVNLAWEITPTDVLFHDIYDAYQLPAIGISAFRCTPGLRVNKAWHDRASSIGLFADHRDPALASFFCSRPSSGYQAFAFVRETFYEDNLGELDAEPIEPYSVTTGNGYFRLQLSGTQDFLHEEYPNVLVLQTQAKGFLPFSRVLADAVYYEHQDLLPTGAVDGIPDTWVKVKPSDNIPFVNQAHYRVPLPREPYTPVVKELFIDYRAKAEPHEIELIHLHPYSGTYEEVDVNDAPTLLPTFEDEGTLYIGLSNLNPGANLNLLFQMAESTADPYLNKAEVQWHYLKDNRWEGNELKADIHILKDETNGLIQSGIIQFALPKDMTDDNTILPSGQHWIRATAALRSRAVAETVKVYAQAAKVEFSPGKNNDLKRLSTKLPASSITAAQPEIGALEGISQDFEGFGGRPKESDDQFYVRVSERLRHKGRAVTLFDYERLVLQAFPEIYRAKCITHTLGRRKLRQPPPPDPDNPPPDTDYQDYHLAPGYVTLALIPDLRNVDQANRLRPRVSAGMLERVKTYLQQRMSPFIRLRVLNPIYEEVSVEMDVKFVKGKSEDYYTQKLKDDLQQFLMPWAYEGQEEISFGGRIFRSTLLSFVEKRPYVDFVQNFKMIDENGKEKDKIEARTTRSILVAGKLEVYLGPCCQSQSEAGAGPDGIGRRRISGGFTIQ